MGAQATELLMAEQATAAEQGLDTAKVRLAEIKVALQKSLEALETERRARSKADQEVLTLRGQVLGAKESNARLLEKVTQQEEGLSILESTHLGLYMFRLWLMPWFFPLLLNLSSFSRNGWKNWFSRARARDSQGGDRSERGGASQVP